MTGTAWIGLLFVILVVVVLLLSKAIIIVREFERCVVLRFGSFNRVMMPGLKLVIPFVESPIIIDYRMESVNVQPQEVMTSDNVTVTVDAYVFYHVRKAKDEVKKAVLEVEDFHRVTTNYGQSMLRAIIGKEELDTLLRERDKIADQLKTQLDKKTDRFGVKVDDVEIKDVSVPGDLERAMASEAEAERERRARIKYSLGELQAAKNIRLASELLGERGYELRTLQTVEDVAVENSTIVTIPSTLVPSKEKEEEMLFEDTIDRIKSGEDLSKIIEEIGDENIQNMAEEVLGDENSEE